MSQESGTQWRKSSYSGHDGGDCVEVARFPGTVGVRDSKNPAGPVHVLERSAFRALVEALRA